MLATVLCFPFVFNLNHCIKVILHPPWSIPFFNRVLESHFQSQKEVYEKEIEGLNHKVEHLSQDINHLQKLFREENDINDGIRLEVSRLTSENLVRARCSKAKYVFVPVIHSTCLCDTKLSKSYSCALETSRLEQI